MTKKSSAKMHNFYQAIINLLFYIVLAVLIALNHTQIELINDMQASLERQEQTLGVMEKCR